MPRRTPSLPADDPLRDAARPGAIRLQKALADAGVASRRNCEELILAGRVEVNGRVVEGLPAFVVPGQDRLVVDGVAVGQAPPSRRRAARDPAEPDREAPGDRPARRVYVMLNKPTHTVTTAADPEGRRTAIDLVKHPLAARLYPVGRLDYDTTGLLLLTNDGELANRLTHPRYGVHKTYRALVKGRVDEDSIGMLEEGIFLAERKEGRTVGAARTARVELRIVKRDATRTLLEVALREGRNRQVRRMLARVGFPVKRLQRVRMGPLELKGLAVGQWRELTRDELRALREAAGLIKPRGPRAAPAPETPEAPRPTKEPPRTPTPARRPRRRIAGAKGPARGEP